MQNSSILDLYEIIEVGINKYLIFYPIVLKLASTLRAAFYENTSFFSFLSFSPLSFICMNRVLYSFTKYSRWCKSRIYRNQKYLMSGYWYNLIYTRGCKYKTVYFSKLNYYFISSESSYRSTNLEDNTK